MTHRIIVAVLFAAFLAWLVWESAAHAAGTWRDLGSVNGVDVYAYPDGPRTCYLATGSSGEVALSCTR